jgi:hypothetical protein
MPLTDFQARLARLLATNRTEDSYLAGGAALHIEPNSKRFSNDLDYFHDSVERVAEAFAQDRRLLESNGYRVSVDMTQPGYIRATIQRDKGATKVEWAHDSSWRFLPTLFDERVGYLLHPIDLAVNKVLTLAGRDEPRDFLDTLHVHHETLPLGALCWAAAGKDPGFTPLSLLELLRRRGKYRPEDFSKLHLAVPVDLPAMKEEWHRALEEAEELINSLPPEEIGCLYYSTKGRTFLAPTADMKDVVPHYGRPCGVLPRILEASTDDP